MEYYNRVKYAEKHCRLAKGRLKKAKYNIKSI